jgi:hypothetical protein
LSGDLGEVADTDVNVDDKYQDSADDGFGSMTDAGLLILRYYPDWCAALLGKSPKSRRLSCHRAYRPWSLRRDALLSFLVILLAMIAALEMLLYVSTRNNGLITSSENERYLWEYGLTAGKYQLDCQRL